jgi:nucleotide-binding universal stress UspA family protein
MAAPWGVGGVETKTLVGTPAEAILQELGEGTADLLVVGSRGRSPVRSTLLGSVSTALLHHAHGSILIARAPARGAGALAGRGPGAAPT